jgi:hypothetical protein
MTLCSPSGARDGRSLNFLERGSAIVAICVVSVVPISGTALAVKTSPAMLGTASGLSVIHLENSQSVDVPLNLTVGPSSAM